MALSSMNIFEDCFAISLEIG
ncbi:hypothetical protein CGLO_14335 [Colletotrichum gloeosporioides Cg-14]|uniref:Uncharacterized protein n=1 Tax=Colletotrichum gloeosporioides (strain Cg-14) TaxID=1237896 RepID=T0L4X0_COLGC|nr:hypothetical protein CGLO_14335 [Colletotrichum gloeosporioides Cg-14]